MLLKTLLNCVILHSCLNTKTYKNPALKIIFLFGIPKRESSNSGFSRVTPFLKIYFWVGVLFSAENLNAVDQSWVFIGRTDTEAETPILWPPDAKSWLIWKDPDGGKDRRWEEKGMTEDQMVGWHHCIMNMSLNKLQNLVMDWETWRATVRGVADRQLSDWTELKFLLYIKDCEFYFLAAIYFCVPIDILEFYFWIWLK